MTQIPPINGGGKLPDLGLRSSPSHGSDEPGAASDELAVDRVEISQTGQALSTMEANAAVRADKVAQIRQAIADGTYMTEDKIAVAADRLLDALRGSRVS